MTLAFCFSVLLPAGGEAPQNGQGAETRTEVTPQIIYVTPEPAEGYFRVDLTTLSDEQLLEAAEAIRAEQRSRIKTHIVIQPAEVTLLAGKSQKLEATAVDLPEGEKTPRLQWETSDKAVVTCNNGQIRAVAEGEAMITCSATLSDGTEIYGECKVKVNVPVASIVPDVKSLSLSIGEEYVPVFTIEPDIASDTGLLFETSDSGVASVTTDGIIMGTGTGNARITAKAKDGSGKSVSISLKVTDNRISQSSLEKILMVAACNYVAEDIFTADGSQYDRKKLHDYTYFDSVLEIIDHGTWTSDDGGNTWHVEDFLVQQKPNRGFFQYAFDVRFDGKNYMLENGQVVTADIQGWLDKSDPSRYGEESLANLDFYVFLTVSPKQIGE